MLKNIFQKKFEQNTTQIASSKIQKIVGSTAREFIRRHRTNDPKLQRKILELAHTTLHMRIYQKYGSQDDETMRSAYDELTQRIVSARPS